MKTDQILRHEKATFETIPAPCPYYGTCGGCNLQDLAYADQLELKRQRLLKALGAIDPTLTVEIVGLPDPWRYRNKAELTFSDSGGTFALGYHAVRSFWRIVDVDDCLLLPEPMSAILRETKALARDTALPCYNPRTHQGFFRYLTVRMSHATGQTMVCLITTQGDRAVVERMADALLERHPQIASLYWGLNTKVADVAIPDEFILLRGNPHLEDRIGPFSIRLSPLNFLQPTPAMAEAMYDRLRTLLASVPSGIAWDLYCGIGLVGFYLSSRVRKVYGIDVEPRHLELAALNASRNGLQNLEFRAGQVETVLRDRRFWLQEARPDVVVVDPPRAGLQPQALTALFAARPAQLAYLSCNAQSLVRDLRVLLTGFPRYRLVDLRAFDMFPQTNHVEILAILERA